MKKVLILAVMVLGVSAFAMAQQNAGDKADSKAPAPTAQNCPCTDMDKMPCDTMGKDGKGKNRGMGKHGDMKDMPAITLKDAKAKVEDYVKANLKGYKVGDVKEFKTRAGHTAFTADATDASGNKFVFHITPFGDVRGPITMDMHNQMQDRMKTK